MTQAVIPNLWCNTDAEAAAAFYVSVFGGQRLGEMRYPEGAGPPGIDAGGEICTVDIEIRGSRITLINGYTDPEHTASCSLLVLCEDQADIDRIWQAMLDAGGAELPCGWITDRWGMHWQIVPRRFQEVIDAGDPAALARAFAAMMDMRKLDEARLLAAAGG